MFRILSNVTINLGLIWEASDQTFQKVQKGPKSSSAKEASDLKKSMNRYQRRLYKIASSTAIIFASLQKESALALNDKIIWFK